MRQDKALMGLSKIEKEGLSGQQHPSCKPRQYLNLPYTLQADDGVFETKIRRLTTYT